MLGMFQLFGDNYVAEDLLYEIEKLVAIEQKKIKFDNITVTYYFNLIKAQQQKTIKLTEHIAHLSSKRNVDFKEDLIDPMLYIN